MHTVELNAFGLRIKSVFPRGTLDGTQQKCSGGRQFDQGAG